MGNSLGLFTQRKTGTFLVIVDEEKFWCRGKADIREVLSRKGYDPDKWREYRPETYFEDVGGVHGTQS